MALIRKEGNWGDLKHPSQWLHPSRRLPAHHHPQKTKRKMATLASPYKAMHMACRHTAWPPWAGKQTNACSWLGCISLHTAVPGCFNSLNRAVITRYLLVTLLDLFHSLGWQTAWTGLVLLTASLPSLHHSHLFRLSPIFPKPSTLLIMMMAGVTELTDSPTLQLSSLGICWHASFCFVLGKVREYRQEK